MLNRKGELAYIFRYSLAGILNAIVGLGSVFFLMSFGFPAIIANTIGYALALTIAFGTGKTFVFQSKAWARPESIRYLIAFVFSFLCNLLILQLSLKYLGLRPWISQGAAITTYVIVMYLCSRFFVFRSTTQ